MSVFDAPSTQCLVRLAVEEDYGRGDITSELLVDATHRSSADLIAREDLRVCGVQIVAALIRAFKFDLSYQLLAQDGADLHAQQGVLELSGPTREILAIERSLLNFIQRLSGVASITREFVKRLPPGVKLLDTRKTIPGWRLLEKYAVLVGGGINHRSSLGDMVLVKNNHIDAFKFAHPDQDLKQILVGVANRKPRWSCLEVEVRNLEELKAVLSDRIDVIMLDNMSLAQAAEAIQYIRSYAPATRIEISGGVSLETIADLAALKPDYISVGSVTRAAPSVDLSLRIKR